MMTPDILGNKALKSEHGLCSRVYAGVEHLISIKQSSLLSPQPVFEIPCKEGGITPSCWNSRLTWELNRL